MTEFPYGFRPVYHLPVFYRYETALPAPRAMWNRYDGPLGTATLGVMFQVGRYAYCVKWADPKLVES